MNSDVDSDEEINTRLERAVMQYKSNKKNSSDAPVFLTKGRRPDTHKINKNQSTEPSGANVDDYKNEQINGNSQLTLGMLDLMKYFIAPKESKRETLEKKTYSDYEKQGAVPKGLAKGRVCPNRSKKNQAKNTKVNSSLDSKNQRTGITQASALKVPFNDNGMDTKNENTEIFEIAKSGVNLNLDYHNGVEKIYPRSFFYIVPEKPCPNFVFPPGSYYVIPKSPDPSCRETIIFHPESSTIVRGQHQQLNWRVEIDSKNQKFDPNSVQNLLPESLNNLGKDSPQPTYPHLNIGPAQVKEECFVNNLETKCNPSKKFEKTVLSPEKSSDAAVVAQNVQERHEENSEDHEEFSCEESNNKVSNLEFDSLGMPVEAKSLSEQEEPEHLDSKLLHLQGLYERMIRALPESRVEDLQEKCLEFQGDEEKVVAYIEEKQRTNKFLWLITEMQHVFPDADPSFLFKEVQQLDDDDDALNILSNQLLEGNYPKISVDACATKKKLWLTYVKNFDVKNYLLKVPKPDDFAGAAGDNNKADEDLIMAFLKSRYRSESEFFLNWQFNLDNRNITKTCASLNELQTTRLSESMFEFENFEEDFLKEICYIEHREEIDNYLETKKVMKEIEEVTAHLDDAFLYCPLCDDEKLIASEAVTCPEGHVFCKECIKRYFETKIGDANYKFQCPSEECDTFFTTSTLEDLLPSNLSTVVILKQQAEEIGAAEVDGLEFCPKCDFAYIPDPENKIFKCQNPSCLEETCRKCHQQNHIPLRCEEIIRPSDDIARKKIEEAMTETLVRRCPNCNRKFVKIDGCNKISCVCGVLLCYICRKRISGYEHFATNQSSNLCPLWSTNDELHVREVIQSGIKVRDGILKENPDIRFLHDPTS